MRQNNVSKSSKAGKQNHAIGTPKDSFSLLTSSYPQGSQWRRWDLHVHTPFSQLGTSFAGLSWDDYVTALESAAEDNGIAVIGVTDYMSIDGYEKLVAAKNIESRLKSVQLLIPNIEFRIMPPTKDGNALNLHLLIDSSDPEHIAKIKRALKNLKFDYNGENYGCVRNELIEFARAQRADLDSDDAYRYGIKQFKPDRTALKEWLDKEAWLRSNCLIGITNGKDGISGLPVGGFGAIRDEVLRWCDLVFSGNPNDRIHYLGQKTDYPMDVIIKQYGALKPCVHGCDAHEVTKLFRPDLDRYCWIKSDPTFQGLRQIVWEPEDRIHIGHVPPQPTDKSRLIRSMSIRDAKGWFAQKDIDFNSGLVAVIGEKGTGKTAIADLAAIAAGVSCDTESQSSFITKGWLHLSGVKVILNWENGTTTPAILPEDPYSTARPLVRYLSQDFVERLCSSDHEGHELQVAIEDVVFARLDEIQKEGYSAFSELRKARESASNTRRERFRGDLATLHKEIERLNQSLEQRQDKIDKKRDAGKQMEDLKNQLPDATQFVDQEVLERLQGQQSLLADLEKDIASKTRRRRTIEDSVQTYHTLRKKVASDVNEIIETLQETGIPSDLTSKLLPKWDDTIDQLLESELKKIDSEVSNLKGREADSAEENTIFTVTKRISELRDRISKAEVSKKRLLDLQKQISERTATVERLAKEIENLDTRVTKQLVQKQNQRLDLYMKFFSALKEDETGLRELYAPMQDAIEKLGTAMKFEIAVGYQIDFRSWLEKMTLFFDGRRSGSDDKRKRIERIIESSLVPAWKKGDVEEIKIAFGQFYEEVDAVSFMKKYAAPHLTLVELYDWMFSVDHIALTYKVRYGGTELEYLSPGTRGIALLVLYLLMDEDDTRPLIIDQPEGNLDNSSVYKQLVPYIRKAKTRRQIILITHNPNLVVATDAEQVIIATAERPGSQPYPCMKYYSGSLEHTSKNNNLGVREAVCLLLEGGKQAFKERENRYAITGY